jgi:chromosome partitioning protein
MAAQPAHVIVFANEKGGSGKSTTAVHVAVALATAGRRVATIDMDTRQRTLARYLENRAATIRRAEIDLPSPSHETFDPAKGTAIGERIDALREEAEIVLIDTPGRDDPHARDAMGRADTLVTPINDSFIDLDLIGQVDAETYKIRRPSFYAELVWDARKVRARSDGGTVDWIVLRNRLQHIEARNMKRVASALGELSKRIGFRSVRTRGVPRAVSQGPYPARSEGDRQRCRHRPHRRPAGIARDGLRAGAARLAGGTRRRRRRMMLLLIVAGAVGWWSWRSGQLQALRFGDVAAGVAALCGIRMLGHGEAPLGLLAIAGAAGWTWLRNHPAPRPAERAGADAPSLSEARSLLDLPAGADRDTIERAHRRLIGRVHPDAGGSTELARRVNMARDMLIAELGRTPPRAS